MVELEIKRHLDADDIAAVKELLDVAEEADGHRPLGEHQWLDLVQGGRKGFAGLVAWEHGHDHPVGYAQVTRSPTAPDSWALEFVVSPHHRDDEGGVGRDLVEAALEVVASEGGGHVHLWVPKPSAMHDAIASTLQLRRGRDLLQLRRPLPIDDAAAVPIDTRAFVPGRDEEAWLEVNNRAFDWHPEQGGWDRQTLEAREAEGWFDPQGFLLYERDGRLAGFCWTKVHADHEPPLGEIYVIAVDPDFAGQGLGRALVVAGLHHLHAEGLRIAMLYVDAANERAVQLYRDLGFHVDHVDRAYVTDVVANPSDAAAG